MTVQTAIPLGKGELPYEVRSTDEEMTEAFLTIKEVHPDAAVLVERKRGGAVKITIAVKGQSRLEYDEQEAPS
jgi:hypothetical protein